MCPGAACEADGRQAGQEVHQHAVTAPQAALLLQDRYSSYARPAMKALENPSLYCCITENLFQWDGVTARPVVPPALG